MQHTNISEIKSNVPLTSAVDVIKDFAISTCINLPTSNLIFWTLQFQSVPTPIYHRTSLIRIYGSSDLCQPGDVALEVTYHESRSGYEECVVDYRLCSFLSYTPHTAVKGWCKFQCSCPEARCTRFMVRVKTTFTDITHEICEVYWEPEMLPVLVV